MEDFLKIRFFGEGIHPNTIRASDLAEALMAYEESLLIILSKIHPNIKDAYISLDKVKDESATYIAEPSVKLELIESASVLNNAIAEGTLNEWPVKIIENLKVIQKVSKKYNGQAELNGSPKVRKVVINHETNLEVDETFFIQGNTTIYGKIERVGGTDPAIRLKLDNGKSITVRVKEKDAKIAASKIYERVGMKGVGKWYKSTKDLESFKLKEFIMLTNTPLEERMSKLSELLYPYWKDIENPDTHISNLRNK